MLIKLYDELIEYINSLISDGIQLIQGDQLLSWNDTKIPEIIAKIELNKDIYKKPKLNPGDRLKHKISGEEFWVIRDDGKTVFLNLTIGVTTYPLDRILYDFTIEKRSKRNK